jgi:hypothetical protein
MTETYAPTSSLTGATALLLEPTPIRRRQRGSLYAALAASSAGAAEGPQAPRMDDAARIRRVLAETVPTSRFSG